SGSPEITASLAGRGRTGGRRGRRRRARGRRGRRRRGRRAGARRRRRGRGRLRSDVALAISDRVGLVADRQAEPILLGVGVDLALGRRLLLAGQQLLDRRRRLGEGLGG